jgi:phospholipid transport system substrate-binding protein
MRSFICRFALAAAVSLAFVNQTSAQSPVVSVNAAPVIAAGDVIVSTFNSLHDSIKDNQGKIPDEALNQKLQVALFSNVDFLKLSERCLGEEWGKATPAEQQELAALFRDILGRSFMDLIRSHAGNMTMAVTEQSVKGDRAVVRTTVSSPDDQTKIDFWLTVSGGKWLLHNITAGAFSVEKLYQLQFTPVARNEGIAGLLSRLRSKS